MVLGLSCSIAFADTGVSVLDKKGVKSSFDKSTISSIKFNSATVEVLDKDSNSTFFDKNDISYILLSDNEAGINLPSIDGKEMNIRLTRSSIILTDAHPGDSWMISDLSGKILKSGKLSNSNEEITIDELTAGVYIFTVGGKSIKIVKK